MFFRFPDEKLDVSKEHVSVGPYTIGERGAVYGLDSLKKEMDEAIEMLPKSQSPLRHSYMRFSIIREYRKKIEFLFEEAEFLLLHEQKTGTWDGHGHGHRTMTLANLDGSLIWQAKKVSYCEGPGYSCSYDHGPWYKYGQYNGSATPDRDLIKALDTKRALESRFSF